MPALSRSLIIDRSEVPRSGVLALSGYGIRVAVERKHLVVSDGIGNQRRAGRFARPTSRIKRLVLLGHSGYVTLEALRWLHHLGAAVIQIDTDGSLMVTTAPAGLDDPRLRRAQALAPFTGAGIPIVHYLLNRKFSAQADALDRFVEAFPDPADFTAQTGDLLRHLGETVLPKIDDASRLRNLEATAADAYWTCWRRLPVRFTRNDLARVPEHWLSFGQRTSLISGSPRLATNPPNAMLNYLYALLEAEARIACLRLGLDPGLGLLHADQRGRDSLALDLMEAVRPAADLLLLDLLAQRTFTGREFTETSEGICRLLAPLPSALSETSPSFAVRLAPIAEHVTNMLGRVTPPIPGSLNAQQRPVTVPTMLSQANRSVGRDRLRRHQKRAEASAIVSLPRACGYCGTYLSDLGRDYCDRCVTARRTENLEAGPAALARLRAEGKDPNHSFETRRKIGLSRTLHNQAILEWEQAHETPDPDEFRCQILPKLQAIPIRRIMAATGLKAGYCSLIRRGERVPHPMHWQAFQSLVASDDDPAFSRIVLQSLSFCGPD